MQVTTSDYQSRCRRAYCHPDLFPVEGHQALPSFSIISSPASAAASPAPCAPSANISPSSSNVVLYILSEHVEPRVVVSSSTLITFSSSVRKPTAWWTSSHPSSTIPTPQRDRPEPPANSYITSLGAHLYRDRCLQLNSSHGYVPATAHRLPLDTTGQEAGRGKSVRLRRQRGGKRS